jgi:hypothetical protein
MGLQLSKIKERDGVNYDCPVCKSKNNPPNLVGKFVSINDYHFKCTGCNNIFNKTSIYLLSSNKEAITLDHVIKV